MYVRSPQTPPSAKGWCQSPIKRRLRDAIPPKLLIAATSYGERKLASRATRARED